MPALLLLSFLLAILPLSALHAQSVGRDGSLIYEAENYSTPTDAWLINRLTENKWNLWSTDVDAERKWSGGVVLQSPLIPHDRATPEEGAPPLHTRITGIPPGTYAVEIRGVGRPLAVSLDGKTWLRKEGSDNQLGLFTITNGIFELWVDDRYAAPDAPRSSYYDAVIFYPAEAPTPKKAVQGHARSRIRERIGRGLVAVPVEGGVYLSWRLLESDPRECAFHVYRQTGSSPAVRLSQAPVRRTTDFLDTKPPSGGARYFIRPVLRGREGPPSEKVIPPATWPGYFSIRLNGDYTFQKVGVADLDADGRYDYVIKQPNVNVDPASTYWTRSQGTYKLEAYQHDGTFLWRYDLGWAIEQGIWYSPYLVYDLDGDGRAEVALKRGEGDPRDPDGRVTSGPEYLAILDGLTGREITSVPWPSRDGFPDYNYYCRNQLGLAYLDGKTPCLIVERGTYNLIKVVAYEFSRGKLRELWRWSTHEETGRYRGQGAHCLRAADVDGDGRDEVILGSAVLDDTGKGLWTTGLGHPDHLTVGDLDPTRPGLEIHYGIEPRQPRNGICMVDAKSGQILWGLDEPTQHIHSSGLCADIDPEHPGTECYGGERDFKEKRWLFSAQGQLLSAGKDMGGLAPRACYWDADPQRELLYGGRLRDFGGAEHPIRIEGAVIAVADIFGDWREEIVTSVPGELRIYMTTIPATDRHICLMQDPIYRNDVATGTQGYYQIPGLLRLPSAESK